MRALSRTPPTSKKSTQITILRRRNSTLRLRSQLACVGILLGATGIRSVRPPPCLGSPLFLLLSLPFWLSSPKGICCFLGPAQQPGAPSSARFCAYGGNVQLFPNQLLPFSCHPYAKREDLLLFVAVVFFFCVLAQKSHVKSQNHLNLSNKTRSSWHFSYVQFVILINSREKRQSPGQEAELTRLFGQI
jgi:hypothetical protein